MKDSYSFDVDDAGLQRSYERHRAAYIATFDRLGLRYEIVSAVSGAMGGSASEEFLASARTARTPSYAARRPVMPPTWRPSPPRARPTAFRRRASREGARHPATPTIATLVDLFNTRADLRRPDRDWTAADTLKNVVVTLVHPDGKSEPLVVGIPGDREVDMKRLEAQVEPAVVTPFTDADFAQHPALVRGYIGPAALGARSASGVRFLVDPRVVTGTRWITGANEPGRHVADLVCGRDFTPDGTIEAAEVRAGDPSPGRRRAADHRAGHRDRPYLPTRPQVRRGA